jgi:hypothetical protein
MRVVGESDLRDEGFDAGADLIPEIIHETLRSSYRTATPDSMARGMTQPLTTTKCHSPIRARQPAGSCSTRRRQRSEIPRTARAAMASAFPTSTLRGWLRAAVAMRVMALVPQPWPMSLAEHFHLHYLAAAAVAALVAAALRQAKLADACAVIALVNLVVVAPPLRAGAPGRSLRIHARARPAPQRAHREHAARAGAAAHRRRGPDVVALVEVDRHWLDALEPSLRDHRGRLEKPRDDRKA